MLTIEGLKAKQISCNPETDIHATLCQKQLHILRGISGVLVTQSSLGVNFCIILGALHLPIMNKRTSRIKNPTRMKDLTGREPSDCLQKEDLFQQTQPGLALGEAHHSTKARHHQQRAVFLWPDKWHNTVLQDKKKKKICFYAFATCYVSFKMQPFHLKVIIATTLSLPFFLLQVRKCSIISKPLYINTRHYYPSFLMSLSLDGSWHLC